MAPAITYIGLSRRMVAPSLLLVHEDDVAVAAIDHAGDSTHYERIDNYCGTMVC